jgi:F0F1-type ATP synthase gamma subunit
LSYYRSKSKFFAVDLHEVEVPIITTASGFELIDEKVMNVWIEWNNKKEKRVVFGKKNGEYLAWQTVETIEAAKETNDISRWDYAEEIPEEEIIELNGIKYKKI